MPEVNTIALFYLGTAQLGSRSLEEADETFVRALGLEPEDAVLHAQGAMVLARMGRFADARVVLAEAERLAPAEVPVLRARADVAMVTKDREATRHVDELLAAEPDHWLGHVMRGELELDRNLPEGLRAFAEAARLAPEDRYVATLARAVRVGAHPVMTPLHWFFRFGRWRSYFLVAAVAVTLSLAGLEAVRGIVILVWLALALLSSIVPSILRRRARRKLGRL